MRRIQLLSALILSTAADAKSPYWIRVSATPTGKFTVAVSVTTNLPDTALLSSSLYLSNQKDYDPLIGASGPKFRPKNGKAHFTLDATKNTSPLNMPIPAGTYDLSISYHPLWDENKISAKKQGATSSIEAVKQVRMAGTGTSVSGAKGNIVTRDWVFDNVGVGDAWDGHFYTMKLGKYTRLASNDPGVLAYYFPTVNMTFLVNARSQTIRTWKLGKASQ